MNHPSPHTDEDQDSLFGSPPPSPARGRSPSQEIVGDQVAPVTAVPSTGVATKNVGTIALPGSHMSCAELPANPPALGLSLSRPTSSHCSPSIAPPTSSFTPRSNSSRASSAVSTIPSVSTKKRSAIKTKSLTPAPPPIAMPGPHEPTPPNFLRSQSSLLGLAGLVGSVKPARLYAHTHHPTPVQQHTPIRGSTPAHPIVLDDDQDAPRIGQQPCAKAHISSRLDQPNPEALRTNILNSLSREKNIFPVLESLIKLLGGEPQPTPVNPQPQPFARPYGHGILNVQSPSSVAPLSTASGLTTPILPPPKRRKLKHVPAGAVDWDVPFPFAAGEGPEGYRDTWARDRAKRLVTQLLELVQNAAKRATIKTVTRGSPSEGLARAQSRKSSRSLSVETQIQQISSTRAHTHEPCTSPSLESAKMTATQDNMKDSLCRFFGSLDSSSTVDSPPTPGSKDGTSIDSEGTMEESGSMACDYSAFEEWLSQLQQFVPLEPNVPTPELDWGARPPVHSDSFGSPASVPMQCDTLSVSHAMRDDAIDPALLAISELGVSESAPRSQSPTSLTLMFLPGDIPQVPTPSTFIHSARTSLSSLTEPLTPLSDVDTPGTGTMVHQDHPPVDKDLRSQIALTRPSEPLPYTGAQKGKVSVDRTSVTSTSTPGMGSDASKGGLLDKHAILERARERRRQLVSEIERAKFELWETSLENALLVHLARDESL